MLTMCATRRWAGKAAGGTTTACYHCLDTLTSVLGTPPYCESTAGGPSDQCNALLEADPSGNSCIGTADQGAPCQFVSLLPFGRHYQVVLGNISNCFPLPPKPEPVPVPGVNHISCSASQAKEIVACHDNK